MIDPKWLPYLQTPPFPEYTSGHSSISATASTVLAALFGTNFAFHDDSDLQYIGMEKEFNSFEEAANEASISRIYGGIHYRFTADVSAAQGKNWEILWLRDLGNDALTSILRENLYGIHFLTLYKRGKSNPNWITFFLFYQYFPPLSGRHSTI